MCLIKKEILALRGEGYDRKKDEFKEVSEEDFKGCWKVVCLYGGEL